MNLASNRREYNLTTLHRSRLKESPIEQFRDWLEEAAGVRRRGCMRRWAIRFYKSALAIDGASGGEVNAATLATADSGGVPSARIILVKAVDERGFVFYTNYESRKGHDLLENPRAALVFYWPHQERQVSVSGTVNRIPREDSIAYFGSRPRASRLAAWASLQSRPVESRAILDRRWKEFDHAFNGNEIPMPEYWGGYRLLPSRLEFWQGRPGRFHDRFCYSKQQDGKWAIERLCP